MISTAPASPSAWVVAVNALLRRFQVGSNPSVSPCSVFNPWLNAGKKSRAARLPLSTSLINSASVSPRPLAAALRAPGIRSPSCWRNSSRLTTPLLAICPRAFSAPPAASALRPREPATRVTVANRSLDTASGMFAARVAALNCTNVAPRVPTARPDACAVLFKKAN